MSERTCGNCRWYEDDVAGGACHRHAPRAVTNDGKKEYRYFTDWPTVFPEDFCGEWADKTITPEQEERRELVRRFAVAIVQGVISHPTLKATQPTIWKMAEELADAEPGNSGREI